MNERERDLIAALADGSLHDESQARALLESSDEALAEYRLQLAALEALSRAGSAAMLESERSALHRDLWTELRAEKAKARSTAGIYGWSLAAAILFVVVGLAAVLGGGVLGGEDTASLEEVSSQLGSPAADMATEETMEAADAPGGEAAMVSPAAQAYFAEQADSLRRGDELSRQADGDAEDEDCLFRAGLSGHEVAAVVGEEPGAGVAGRYLAAVPAGEAIGAATPVHFVDSASCEQFYTDR